MSLLETKKLPEPPPRSCSLCRHWAPWLRQEMLGTCGGPQIGQCTDKFDTCDGFEPKKEEKPSWLS